MQMALRMGEGHRGSVTEAKVKEKRITVKFDLNPKWDLPAQEKVSYLEEWIAAKVRKVFKVVSVTGEDEIT